jgi:hypothetical protein
MYVTWLPHSWLKGAIYEWRPTYDVAPTLLPILFLPVLVFSRRIGWGKTPRADMVLWIFLTIAAIASSRFLLFAAAIGVPAGCAAVRSSFAIPLGTNMRAVAGVVVIGFLVAFGIFRYEFFRGPAVLEPAFGLIVPGASAQAQLPDIPAEPGRLTLCAKPTDCTVLLFFGGRDVFDQRLDPFPESVYREQNRFFVDSADPLRSEVDRVILNTTLPRLQPPPGFNRITQQGDLIIYDRGPLPQPLGKNALR